MDKNVSIEASRGDASEVATSRQPQMNFPLSPPAQSHFLFSEVVVQDGQDSDAGVVHKAATNLEDPQEIDEIDITQVGDDGTASNGVEKAQSSDNFVDIPPAELSKLNVWELKTELSKHGQSTNGLKAVLLDCLKNALEQCLPALSSANEAAHLTNDLTGFSANA